MKAKWKILIGLVLVTAALFVAVAYLCSGGEERPVARQARVTARTQKARPARGKRMPQRNGASKVSLRDETRSAFPRERPMSERQETRIAVAELTPQQKSVLADLQDALDHENLQAVRSTIDLFNDPALRTAQGEVPVALRAQAVEALGWFGKNGAIDLIGLLGDPDPEVAEDALDQFGMALEDGDMSDRERATIVTAALRAVTDREIIDQLLTQLDNMRNSCRAATIIAILTTGTRPARDLMTQQLPDYTEDGVIGVEDVKKWRAENPDDENDDEFYGGSKDTGTKETPVARVTP